MSEELIPQEWFETDEEPEKPPSFGDKLGWYIKRLVALSILLVLLYVSGVYQGTLFHKTPNRHQEPLPSILEIDNIDVHIRFVVFESSGELGSERNKENVYILASNSSSIWKQADINLIVDEIVFTQVSDEEISSFTEYPITLIGNNTDNLYLGISVFLFEGLSGLNGIAFSSLQTVAVADYTTVNDYRTLAHEIGHIFGLSHTKDQRDLMFSGSNGTDFSKNEIDKSRSSAEILSI